jgi:hypothetical protein
MIGKKNSTNRTQVTSRAQSLILPQPEVWATPFAIFLELWGEQFWGSHLCDLNPWNKGLWIEEIILLLLCLFINYGFKEDVD